MTQPMTGVIETMRRDNKGLKIGDNWFSVYNAADMNGAQTGDTVAFNYVQKGQWLNIKGPVTVTAKGQGAPVGGAAPAILGGGGGSKNDSFRDPDQIMRGEAMTNAVAFLGTLPEGHDYAQGITRLARTADIFFGYVSGTLSTVDSAPAPAPALAVTHTEQVATVAVQPAAEGIIPVVAPVPVAEPILPSAEQTLNPLEAFVAGGQ